MTFDEFVEAHQQAMFDEYRAKLKMWREWHQALAEPTTAESYWRDQSAEHQSMQLPYR